MRVRIEITLEAQAPHGLEAFADDVEERVRGQWWPENASVLEVTLRPNL